MQGDVPYAFLRHGCFSYLFQSRRVNFLLSPNDPWEFPIPICRLLLDRQPQNGVSEVRNGRFVDCTDCADSEWVVVDERLLDISSDLTCSKAAVLPVLQSGVAMNRCRMQGDFTSLIFCSEFTCLMYPMPGASTSC